MTLDEAYKIVKESDKKYYCYVLRDGMKPFYIGIGGKKRRIREHSYEVTAYKKGTLNVKRPNLGKIGKMVNIESRGDFVDYGVIGFYDSWEEACEVEAELISFVGRVANGGPLLNMTDGGDGAAGRPASDKQKEAARKANSKPKSRESIQKMIDTKNKTDGWAKSFLGKTHTEEWRKAMSERMSGENSPFYGKRGELCHNFGRTHSEETRKLISEKVRKHFDPLLEAKRKAKEEFDKNFHGPAYPGNICRKRAAKVAVEELKQNPERSAEAVFSKMGNKKPSGMKARLKKYIDNILAGNPTTQSKDLLIRLENLEFRERFLSKLLEIYNSLEE